MTPEPAWPAVQIARLRERPAGDKLTAGPGAIGELKWEEALGGVLWALPCRKKGDRRVAEQ